MVSWEGKRQVTKGELVPPNPLLAKARVAKGFDMMYRRFTQTPGNTLSMQASLPGALNIYYFEGSSFCNSCH